jgi:uncharacterized protein with beta-barrel porin domain
MATHVTLASYSAIEVASRSQNRGGLSRASVRRSAVRTAGTMAALMLVPLAFVFATNANAESLQSFAILAGSTITNTGPTTISGNVGLSPGSATPGLLPIMVTSGTIHAADAVALQAQSDLTTAYNVLAGRPSTVDLTGQVLGVGTAGALTAGVYNFDTSAQLTGALTLNGNANDVFIFQIGTTLTTAPGSSIVLGGTVQASNVFFVVGSSATLDTTTAFKGQILALTSIALNNAATINCGAAWARNGAVTLINNTINICTFAAPAAFTSGLGGTATSNQAAVGGAIDDYVTGGGTLPLGFSILALLTPAELAGALNQISGEAATGVAPSSMQAMDSFMNLVLNGRRGPGVLSASGESLTPGSNTVSVMGYLPQSAPATGSAFASFDQGAGAMPDVSGWNIWVSSFGAYSHTTGDAAVGSHDRMSRDFGIAAGLDYRVTGDTMVGFALSGGGTGFGLSDNLGGGQSAMLQAAAYGRTNIDNAYVAGALGYGYQAVSTDRYVTFAGIDHFTANFPAQNVAGQIEVGYHIGWFTPYAALRGQAFATPAYSENTASGASTFALAYSAQTAMAARSELGAKIDWTAELDTGSLAMHAGAAWAHDYGSNTSIDAAFLALPGSSFTVEGAKAAADSLLLSAGAEIGFDNGFALAGSVNGGFAQNAQTYSGSVHLSRSW